MNGIGSRLSFSEKWKRCLEFLIFALRTHIATGPGAVPVDVPGPRPCPIRDRRGRSARDARLGCGAGAGGGRRTGRSRTESTVLSGGSATENRNATSPTRHATRRLPCEGREASVWATTRATEMLFRLIADHQRAHPPASTVSNEAFAARPHPCRPGAAACRTWSGKVVWAYEQWCQSMRRSAQADGDHGRVRAW